MCLHVYYIRTSALASSSSSLSSSPLLLSLLILIPIPILALLLLLRTHEVAGPEGTPARLLEDASPSPSPSPGPALVFAVALKVPKPNRGKDVGSDIDTDAILLLQLLLLLPRLPGEAAVESENALHEGTCIALREQRTIAAAAVSDEGVNLDDGNGPRRRWRRLAPGFRCCGCIVQRVPPAVKGKAPVQAAGASGVIDAG